MRAAWAIVRVDWLTATSYRLQLVLSVGAMRMTSVLTRLGMQDSFILAYEGAALQKRAPIS